MTVEDIEHNRTCQGAGSKSDIVYEAFIDELGELGILDPTDYVHTDDPTHLSELTFAMPYDMSGPGIEARVRFILKERT